MENEKKYEYQEGREEGIPQENAYRKDQDKKKMYDFYNYRQAKKNRGNMIGGFILIVMGGLFLADNLIPGFRFSDYWPLILIAAGFGMIFGAFK